MLVTKNKVFRFFFLVSLIVFSGQNLSYGQQGITPISERTPQVRDAIAAAIGVDVGEISETHLKAVTSLNLRDRSITSLKAGDFSGLTALTSLNLHKNQLQSLPIGIFRGLTSLQTLRLAGNAIEPLPIKVSLQKVAEGQFKAVTPTGAPFDIVLPVVVTNGNITDGATQVVIPKGGVESRVLSVSRPADMITAVTVDIGLLPECPSGYYGCILSKSGPFPLEVLRTANSAPVFTEGPNTTRIVAENAVSGIHIGPALTVTDADNDELTFSLGGPDAAAFYIESTIGQLTTYAALNYETQPIYTVTVTASDGSLTDTITVTIHVNAAPKFREGEITTRVVMEDTPSGTTLGKAISAVDLNDDSLTYTLGGIDAEAFELDSKNHLKTRVPLGYDNRRVYCVTITASDGNLTDTITVVTSVISINDMFMFPEFVPVSERTPQVSDAIVAALPDVQHAEDVTLAHLATITHLNLRNSGISELRSGDFSGLTALTDLNLYNNYLKVLPKGIFKDLTMLKTLRLGSNAVKKASVILYLKQVSENEFKVVVPTGAPFDMILPVTVINGVMISGETPLVIPQGSTESAIFGVACPLGRPITPTVVLNTLPKLPRGHYGYRIAQSTVHLRTPQVAEAITAAVPDVADPHYVTDIHLAAITTLKLNDKKIGSLKAGDFAGMLSLRTIFLQNNELTSLPYNIFDGLMGLTHLDLSGNEFTSVPISFDKLLSLRYLNLSGNRLTSLSESIFEGITELEQLHLAGNLVDPLPLWVTLENVGDAQFKVVVPAGAPFTMNLPVTVENGSVANGVTSITIWTGEVESQPRTVRRAANTVDAVTADIGPLPNIPEFHTGYVLVKSDGTELVPLPLAVIESINVPPVFPEGESAVRTVAENTSSGVFIGTAIVATDANKENVLTYSLGGPDAASFDIDEKTGQLKTKVPLDYETKPTYTVIITVQDENGGSSSITVTINVPDVNEPPVFTERSGTMRTIAENTPSGVNIGSPITATDPEGDTFTYALGGTDAASFDIDEKTGQLKTKAPLDYETKSTYTVIVNAFHLNDEATIINVTVNVTDINESPVFTEGNSTTRTIAENTGSSVNIGSPIAATDPEGNTLIYRLGGTDANAFTIDSGTGQLQTKAALDYETKSIYSVTITADDGNGGSASVDVTINITDINEQLVNEDPISEQPGNQDPINGQPVNSAPVFTEGSSTTRSIAENTASGVNIGIPVSATDADGDTLTYSLGGTDTKTFSIDSKTGQLQTKAALDYETKSSYPITITANDGKGGSASITVTINITDIDEQPVNEDPIPIIEQPVNEDSKSEQPVNEDPINKETDNNAPVFTEGSSTTRSIAENTDSGVNIGTPVAATDADDDTLTYRLGGTDENAFSLDSSSGQLRTSAELDYETKPTYTTTIIADDGKGGNASIDVIINVIGIESELAQSISIDGQNRSPVFTEGAATTRSVAKNAVNGVKIGSAVAATDPDGDTLTYSLGGTDADDFSIDSETGQLKTNTAFTPAINADGSVGQTRAKSTINYQIQTAYTVTITADDGNGGSASITVRINVSNVNELGENNVPVFTEGSSTTRSIAENTEIGIHIGSAVTATDADGDTLTYSLGGTDANAFIIDSNSGQLKTSAALDYETKSTYTTTITADDGNGGSASITVTVNVTNVNEAPVFTEGSSTTRSVDENTESRVEIGSAITATDPEGETVTYSLGGSDASVFIIDSSSGSLKTSAALDYEKKTSYIVTITADDGKGRSASITVTININDINEPKNVPKVVPLTNVPNRPPAFPEGSSTTRTIAENTASGVNIGKPAAAIDPDGDRLTYSLAGPDSSAFSFDIATAQLQTKAALDYETKPAYTVIVVANDGRAGHSRLMTVTVNLTNVNDNAPVFTEGSSTTRKAIVRSPVNTNFGSPVTATDADGDTLTYSLSGPDTNLFSNPFSIDSTTGQLKVARFLPFSMEASVTITASDGIFTGTTTVTITVGKNVAPVFTDGSSTTRSIAENTASGTNIGSPVSATDADEHPLTYSLGGTDAASFSIDSSTGQLQTKAALDYETKSSYSITITADDGNGGSASINVTVNLTNVNDNAPVFTESGSITRSITENSASGTNIGSPVSATDADGDAIRYSLSGIDARSFSLNSSTGQLQTRAALDRETKSTYYVIVRATDYQTQIPVSVTINVVGNRAPVFSEGSSTTRSIAENTVSGTNLGTPVAATDADGDTLTYSLDSTTTLRLDSSGFLVPISSDGASFSIDSTGQLKTKAALDHETKSSYTLTITASDGNGGSASINVTVSVTDVNETPVFTDGSSTTRKALLNSPINTNVGSPVSATDADGDTLTYSLGGTDKDAFSIDSTTGQLKAATVFHPTNSFEFQFVVTITASDGSLTDTITVTITVGRNTAPVFTDGSTTTRSIAENTASDTNIGTVVAATDAEGHTITYSFGSTTSLSDDGTGLPILMSNDADAFSIDSSTGQLQTRVTLDHEKKSSYTFTITADDGNGGNASIKVTVDVTDVNDPPVFTDGSSTTRYVIGNMVGNKHAGNPVAALDEDGDTLTYSLSGADVSWFSINSNTGQISLNNVQFYSWAVTYYVTVNVSDGKGGSASIKVTIIRNYAPVFTNANSTTHSIAENTASSTNIGTPFTATDADGDTLTYSLGGTDAASFSINSSTGQLQTNAALDYETKSSNSITITADVGKDGSASIDVTVNVTNVNEAPVFNEGSSTTRSIVETALVATDIGSPITAKDPDEGDEPTYSLSGTHSGRFTIDWHTGQLKTSYSFYLFNIGDSLPVRVTATDGVLSSTITVTINVVAPSSAPVAQQSPAKTVLLANYPNPFNPETWIPYQLSKSAKVSLTIYNVKGEMVRQLALGHKAAGSYLSRSRAIHWDGRNESGEKVSTGVYFYRLTAGDFSATRRMLIIK